VNLLPSLLWIQESRRLWSASAQTSEGLWGVFNDRCEGVYHEISCHLLWLVAIPSIFNDICIEAGERWHFSHNDFCRADSALFHESSLFVWACASTSSETDQDYRWRWFHDIQT
jgi:hypothetical protein